MLFRSDAFANVSVRISVLAADKDPFGAISEDSSPEANFML